MEKPKKLPRCGIETEKLDDIAAVGELGTLRLTPVIAGLGGEGGVRVVGSYAPKPVYEAPGTAVVDVVRIAEPVYIVTDATDAAAETAGIKVVRITRTMGRLDRSHCLVLSFECGYGRDGPAMDEDNGWPISEGASGRLKSVISFQNKPKVPLSKARPRG